MKRLPFSIGALCVTAFCFLLSQSLLAHNGKVAPAYPLGAIKVDGDFSDWPQNATKYDISIFLSDSKPQNSEDFSGFFQVGYRVEDRSLYLAFTITDKDFIEDTSADVRWNTQDGLELSIDARHLAAGSGVASFMYSKKLRNINNTYYDPFSKAATWDIMEVMMVQRGNQRFYEWRIKLNDEFAVGKSVGLDFLLFDKDPDGSFTFAGWGSGGFKFRNPHSLGDILLLPADEKFGSVHGDIKWNKPMNVQLPSVVRLTSTKNPKIWVQAAVDSLGHYKTELPVGEYQVALGQKYLVRNNTVYNASQERSLTVKVKSGKDSDVKTLVLNGTEAPDLIGEKGVLHDFNATTEKDIDRFIQSYQEYYNIPGVSLALIKDGKVAYYKTYGVKNTFTHEPVDANTLFEAASVTKPVFAHAVERLAERGVIDLDKPLYEYLPYKDIEDDERYKLITARHVLTHRTGFPNWREGKLTIRFTPGTDYGYSGEGFEYLKWVVEKVTGKKIQQVLQEEVIEPIGLYHTFFARNDSLRNMVASGHYDLLPNYDELPVYPGMAWSMHTEANIFTKFMLYLLEQKGLSAQTYQTILSKHSEYKLDPGDEKPPYPVYMGMSLEICETPFGKSFGHGGNNGDFKCRFEVYKDLKMGYVVFTNSNTSDALLEAMRYFLVEGKPKPAKP